MLNVLKLLEIDKKKVKQWYIEVSWLTDHKEIQETYKVYAILYILSRVSISLW